ncbi:SRPBCC domain-containing protein [Frankia sp. CNm7]|uniref:SRPBCC domain-containing protein n=1 Tax=Frankia nepalensis TaxID=1836974 RepID=A0A937RH45_9ACTN|nr:SRPBCC domain-containing protein [Frankia nepalensis]MBL7495628.1 SRPBCC domain-containing protein [Frankia nepalensis]MBL7508874.1 SRPBCC domain-containing protein [Frankia nepalensis]MBL7520322.1 SRPBCC domain-containing protein [Frankia nepalensis]MBL7630097.1 SRPBCC domain-containing protein [Frankia nepalensis]
MNPELDLTLERLIQAPRAAVWKAWTDPANLERWWLPAPTLCRVDRLEIRPGGAFVTRLSDDGTAFTPHLDACFLVVDELERIVFTNAIDSAWRPAVPAPVPMTAEITFHDHPDGTDYRVVVRHGDPAARDRHRDLGFLEGWGAVTEQLARLAESGSAQEN